MKNQKFDVEEQNNEEPYNKDYWYSQGNIWLKKNDLLKAYNCAIRGLKIDSNDVKTWNLVAKVYEQNGEYNSAISAFNKALSIKSNNKILWNNIGYVYYLNKDFGKAYDALIHALDIDPNYKRSMRILGQVLYKKGEYNEAIICFKKYLKLEEKKYEKNIIYHIAKIYLKAGNNEEAKNYFKQILDLDNTYKDVKKLSDSLSPTQSLKLNTKKIDSKLTEALQENVQEEIGNIRRSNEVLLAIFGIFFGFLIATINIESNYGPIILFFLTTLIGFGISILLEILIANLLLKSLRELYRTWDIGRTFYLLDELNVLFVLSSGILWLFKVNLSKYNLMFFFAIIIVELLLFSIRYRKTQVEDPFNKKYNLHFGTILNLSYEEINSFLERHSTITKEQIESIIDSKLSNLKDSNLNKNFAYRNVIKILYRINYLEKIFDPITKKIYFYLKKPLN